MLVCIPCRRGYDVFAFAAAGTALAAGLDICPIAIDAAKAEQQQRLAGNATASAAVHLTAGDFFRHAQDPGFKGPYDIGYDYTFLCALHPGKRGMLLSSWAVHSGLLNVHGYSACNLYCFLHSCDKYSQISRACSVCAGPPPHHTPCGPQLPPLCDCLPPPPGPDMRKDWARSWGQILTPGGTLVTMVYPIDASLGEGPPWPVTPELYRELLLPAGEIFVLLSDSGGAGGRGGGDRELSPPAGVSYV